MKWVFNSKMERKGDCGSCPFLIYDYYNDVGNYYCNLLERVLKEGKDMRKDCPLEEKE